MVRAFAANRAKVAFLDIQPEAGAAMMAETGARFIHCDVTDTRALKTAIAEIRNALGPIGILINNAANDDRRGIDDVDEIYWDGQQNVNLRHQFFAAQAVRPHMRELGGGAIINFSSISYHYGSDHMIAYATAKSAVIGLTNALARGFSGDNIRVNAIEPGAVITPRQRQLWYTTEESVQSMVERQLVRRILTGDDVARLALFLASDDSGMITKQSIAIDAGLR